MIDLKRQAKRSARQEAKRNRRAAYLRDLEPPVRYLVRYRTGQHLLHTIAAHPGDVFADRLIGARVMGTHESIDHARRRLGWS